MIFNSYQYLVFFIVIFTLYFVCSSKYRWIILLIGSYYFYMSSNPKYVIFILFSTILTYFFALKIEKIENISTRKKYLICCLIVNIFALLFFKYFNFFNVNLQLLAEKLSFNWRIPNLKYVMPLGISFYTFQTTGYLIDVYKKKSVAEKSLGKYALFVIFFPLVLAGPIERSTNFLKQLDKKVYFDYERIKDGLLLILWGLFKKIVIADRLAALVNNVFNNVENYRGFPLMIASVFFTFQIYCDFSSYSDIAVGSARVLGYSLIRNFNTPYFSKSVGEFWRRWHISLSTWFRDYLYIPLGGNRVTKQRKYLNLMIVFLVSGLWHGANWTFILWGALHGVYQILGSELKNFKDKIIKIFKINEESYTYRVFQIFITFFLVNFAWIFFRVNSLKDGKYFIKNMFKIDFNFLFNGNIYKLGLDKADFRLSILLIIGLIVIEYFNNRNNIKIKLKREPLITRWAIYYILIFSIIIFGFYGGKYDASQFIYLQF